MQWYGPSAKSRSHLITHKKGFKETLIMFFNRGFGRNIISLAQNLGYQLLPIMLLITEPGLVINKKSLNCISISSTLLFLRIFLLLHFSWNFNISYKVHFLTLAFNSLSFFQSKMCAPKKSSQYQVLRALAHWIQI